MSYANSVFSSKNNGNSSSAVSSFSDSASATAANTPSTLSVEDGYMPCTDGRYLTYEKYYDTSYSTVDIQKNVTVDEDQINITQEENSQYIPFKFDRYWDGIDLMEMLIQFHYVNPDGEGGVSTAVNVGYNDTEIVCGWLVDLAVTSVTGEVDFEITATGVNERGETYKWRTRPNGKLNILEALSYESIVRPADDWFTSFERMMIDYVSDAQQYAERAEAAAEGISTHEIVEEVENYIMGDIDDKIDTKLNDYYDKNEIDNALDNIHSLTNLEVTYDNDTGDLVFTDRVSSTESSTLATVNINSLSNLVVEYTTNDGKGYLTFYDGETELQTVEIGNTDPSAEWTAAFLEEIEQKINDAIESSIGELEIAVTNLTVTVTSLSTEVSEMSQTVSGMEADVTEALNLATTASNELAVIKSDVANNTSDISDLNEALSELAEEVDSIDKTPPYEYDVSYEDNVFTFYENEDIKQQFVITGGSGADNSVITIERITASDAIFLSTDTALIEFYFTSVDNVGDSTGNATATWRVGSTTVATSTLTQGYNSFDITDYLTVGSNTVRLTVTDAFGTISSKTWTITVVEFKLESTFDDTLFYTDDVTFRYTPYGSISKDIIFVLDNVQIASVTTTVTGRQLTQTIPAQSHGDHMLEVYMTAVVNDQTVRSDSIYKDIIWIDASDTTPVIGCSTTYFEALQYNTTPITYVVYDPSRSTTSIQLAVDGEVVSNLTVDRTAQVWSYRSDTFGTQTLTITCGETVKTITAVIEELDIDVNPVTTNLAFDFNPTGKNNNDPDWLKIDDNYTLQISDNFDTSNGGYQIDEDGDTYFCVKSGTTAAIPYELFGDDAKRTGKEFKVIFKTTNVKDYDAQAISCYANNIGIDIHAQQATLYSEQDDLTAYYCEDEFIEFEFNILPDSEYTEMVLWVDAVPTRVKIYAASDSFTQNNPQYITIGSDDCDVWIYRMKAYTMNLTDDEILDNFIADAKNADEMVNRYTRNQIIDASGELDPDMVAETCPDLRIIKISAPHFTTGKKNSVEGTTVQQIYVNGRSIEDNWTATGSHSGQGTSSEYYGDSARNIDIKMSGGFTFADGSTSDTYAMTENSIPVNYFNIKLNVASSENCNNAILVDEYNEFNPYTREAKAADPMVRDTMEFHPCVVFIQETDIPNAEVFYDGLWHFYGCGDFGNSKKNSAVFGMDPDNHKEVIIEVDNNTDEQTRFLSDDLSEEDWSGDHSFEFRYINDDCTDEEEQAAKDAWQRVLSWVVNATPTQFVNEFEDYFVKDSLLFWYLFTERHTMIDSRAKNTFFHTTDLIHWDACMDYDNDTAMGNDNEGGLTFTYGLEDTDMIDTKAVFNAYDSKLWCYIRDNFFDDLQALFLRLEGNLAWSADRIITKCEEYQQMKPERLWIMDMRRKYFRPYEDAGTTSYLSMMHGDKKHQRRQFQKYQERYISSKYVGSVCTSDVITMRGYTPANWAGVEPDGTFHIVPYADMYVVNRYGSNVVKQRAKRGNTYVVESPIAQMNDTEVYTYTASSIQSIGDISGFYAGYTNFSMAVKLTDLLVGSGVEGYQNNNMEDFDIGNNVLLEKLNLQNLPNLTKAIDLSACINLIEFLADGSGISGVIFATGGKIETAHLPAITSLTAKNLSHLTDLQIESYENLTTLNIENCDSIDSLSIVQGSPNLARVRLTGIDWALEDTDVLDKIAGLAGIDENGYNTDTSVLEGKVYVTTMRMVKLAEYEELWPDLEITYENLITQYMVTFVNADEDHTVLDVQYVDIGGSAEDPVTRANNPIATPTIESTISTDYTFSGWDSSLTNVFADRTITAVYTESTRQYTVQYVSRGTVLQTTTAPYGSMVAYEGDLPTYKAGESAYVYNLFTGWDKSGLVDGDKTINAVYDTCEYTDGCFDGKEIGDLRPVEIYAVMSRGIESDLFEVGDSMELQFGNDYNYDDIEQVEVISAPITFDGSSYYNSGITVMDIDRDFVVAIDYKFASSGNNNGSTLAQCFQYNGSNGFRLWTSSSTPTLSWGTSTTTSASAGTRTMLVLRHLAGSEDLMVYDANVTGDDITDVTLTAARVPSVSSNLVFGAALADDGIYENYACGTVYWCKVWYADLGDTECRELAQWTHESIPVAIAKFRSYYLTENSSRRAPLTFFAEGLMASTHIFRSSSVNSGGWAESELNTWLNHRLYNALSPEWKYLIQAVDVYSSIGDKSTDLSVSSCYFYAPSLYEVDPTATAAPYVNETDTTIAYLTGTNARRRADAEDGTYAEYWTRSPNVGYTQYIYGVEDSGTVDGYILPNQSRRIALMFSINT